jgi:CHAT domain-containing protein
VFGVITMLRLLRRLPGLLFMISLVLTLWFAHGWFPLQVKAASPAQLVQDGVDFYAAGDYQRAIDTWQSVLESYPPDAALAEQAVVHENLARAHQRLGQPAAALNAWEAATAAYQQLGNGSQVGRMLTEQAQVYLSQGQHRRAIALLCMPDAADTVTADTEEKDETDCVPGSSLAIADDSNDTLGEVAALGSLGESYRLLGDYDKAEGFLYQGLALAEEAGYSQFEAPMLNSLGSIYNRQAQVAFRRAEDARQIGLSAESDPRAGLTGIADEFASQAQASEDEALQFLLHALGMVQQQNDLTGELQTQLNLLPIYRRQMNEAELTATQRRIGELIDQLPANRQTAYGAIALGKSYQPLRAAFNCQTLQNSPAWGTTSREQSQAWLARGATLAADINDQRAESFAKGELGHLAECQSNWETAMALTQAASLAATEGLESTDSLYLWQWQMARIYREQAQLETALTYYEQAVATLDSIRTEILVADQDVQFDFRDTVEPIYRELIALQLTLALPDEPVPTKQNVESSPQSQSAALLESALVATDSLRLAELQNYFGNDCILEPVAAARVDLLAASTNTAVLSSIIFPNGQTVLMATIPNRPTRVIRIGNSEQLQADIINFRLGLAAYFEEGYDTTLAEALYGQIIAPLKEDLEAANINTLVFIQDGFLRSVPMGALYDGQQFLIEKYAVATTPALTLTAPEARQTEGMQALVLGSSQEVTVGDRRFSALQAVPTEVESIVSALPGSKSFLDEAFSKQQLEQALQENNYSILHFATHGQFSPDPQDNFIITGLGETVTFGQLESFIRSSTPDNQQVDLVMLTACETAAGDDRATLGLAGVAIRAGARSAIASLWQADDLTTAQITQDFYKYLQDPNLNKAQALQQAQINALRSSASVTPGMWAPLILVGNWL